MKKIYKFNYTILLLVVVVIFIGLFKIIEVKNIDISTLEDKIEQTTDISLMDNDNGKKLRKLYGINKNDVQSFILYAPKSNMQANEILVLKAKNQDDLKELKEKVNTRLKSQSDSFKNYDESQYEIISNYVLEEENDYLIFIVSKDSKSIKDSINNCF